MKESSAAGVESRAYVEPEIEFASLMKRFGIDVDTFGDGDGRPDRHAFDELLARLASG